MKALDILPGTVAQIAVTEAVESGDAIMDVVHLDVKAIVGFLAAMPVLLQNVVG